MAKFRSLPTEIEAEQFYLGQSLPFRDRGECVTCVRGDYVVRTAQGIQVMLREGDWVVLEPTNTLGELRAYPVRADIFTAKYQPI